MTRSKQTKLLISLAKKLETAHRTNTPPTKQSSLQSAKILTRNGNFSSHYKNLEKVVKSK